MKENEKDAAFIANARTLLDEGLQDLDCQTLSQLREARRNAIKTGKQTISWMLPATGIAASCAVLLAFFLFIKEPPQKKIFSGMEDIELLAAPEPLEFYEDLAFYSWLEARDIEG